MKFLLLALTLLSPSALASEVRVLTMLRMDIDSDKNDDVLQVLEFRRTSNPLITDRIVEVILAKGGRHIRFPGLLAAVTYKPSGNNPCHSNVEESGEQLKFGSDLHVSLKRTDEASFVVTEEYEDMGCSYYGERSFQTSLGASGFSLEKATRLIGHTGMGGGYFSKGEFLFGKYGHGHEELMDRSGSDEDNGEHDWEIPESCAITLEKIQKQQLPACAEYKKP